MHDVAFLPMLRLQASDEQLAKWLPLVESFQMFGCYAQTEIGHGKHENYVSCVCFVVQYKSIGME